TMAERVRFAGDPVPQETGVPGSQPNIPLSSSVPATSVEMLNKDEDDAEEATLKDFRKAPKASKVDDDDEHEEDEEAGPAYARERIGARIGLPLEEAQQVTAVEQKLEADDVVPCMFQKEVRLQDGGLMHIWSPGVHLVPVAIAGRTPKERHWWLKHNKVRHTGPVQKNPNSDDRVLAEVEED